MNNSGMNKVAITHDTRGILDMLANNSNEASTTYMIEVDRLTNIVNNLLPVQPEAACEQNITDTPSGFATLQIQKNISMINDETIKLRDLVSRLEEL